MSILRVSWIVLTAVLAVLAGALAPGAAAEGPRDGQAPAGRFTSGVHVVEVYATVTDAAGRPVRGLLSSDFEVLEDGRPQAIATFAEGAFPLTVALGVDRSWSMAGRALDLAKQASRGFLRGLKPTDRSMVVSIGTEAEVIAALSEDRGRQQDLIATLDPWGTTALHDATIAALDRLDGEPGRQAFVMFSDGNDRYSRSSAAEVVARVRRSRALVYPITVGRQRPALMVELAALSGGRSFLVRDARELETALGVVAEELRWQYLLGYAPARTGEAGPGRWRSIQVRLRGPHAGARVRARDGYEGD